MKFKFLTIMLVAPFLAVATSHASEPLPSTAVLKTTDVPLIFGDTYVSVGASAELHGDVLASTYLVAGATTDVTGHIQTGTAVTLGASSRVGGEINSDTAITLGASSIVNGRACFGTALTQGASAIYDESSCGDIKTMTYNRDELVAEKDGLSALTNLDDSNVLESFISQDLTLNPVHGLVASVGNLGVTYVYDATSLTTGENVTITLTDGVNYVFNIADMMSLGAGTQIKFSGDNAANHTVKWNIGGYTSLGTDAKIEGKVLSSGYVSTGVRSEVCKGLFSANSYVTVGASAKVGTCDFD